MRTAFAVAALVGMAKFAFATSPPACLLAAIGPQDNASDVSKICKDRQKDLVDLLVKNCPSEGALDGAFDALVSTCEEAGVKITAKLPETSTTTARKPTASSTGSSSASSTSSSNSKPTADNDTKDNGDGSGEQDAASGIIPSLLVTLVGAGLGLAFVL